MVEEKLSEMMADLDDDFLLPEEETILSAENQPAAFPRRPPPASSSGMWLRVVILVLFLLSLGGLGYYYFAWDSQFPEPLAEPEVAATVGTDQPVSDLPEERAEPLLPPVTSPVEPIAVPERQEIFPAAPVASTPASKSPAAGKTAPIPGKPSPVLDKPAPVSAVKAAAYTLQAGVFLRKSSLDKAEKVIRQLGYEPEVTTSTRETEMTRLLVGTFPVPEARTFLAGLKPAVPEAFMLAQDGQASVYAGSFSVPAEARQLAGRLATEGITVQEVVVKVPLPVYRLTFGTFTDREAAGSVAGQAVAAGLEKPLVKRR